MTNTVEKIQVLYEIAMSIGNSLDIKQMLRISLSALLRKLNCSGVSVHFLERDHNNNSVYKQIYATPRNITRNPLHQLALKNLPSEESFHFGHLNIHQNKVIRNFF